MTRLARLATALAVLLGLAAAGGVAGAEGVAPESRRFDGVPLRIAVMDASAIGGPARAHAESWSRRSGGRATVVAIPYDRLFDTIKQALDSPTPDFDVVLYASGWTGDFFPSLSELPAALADNEEFDDIHPLYRERLMRWNGRLIAVVIDGDLYMGYFRKDLFEDLGNRRDFEARYGYELAPPATWAQYRDIAEFFTGRKDKHGEPLYGTTEAFAIGTQQFWNVFSRAAAYTNPPGTTGEQFFEPDTMEPQIANPGWIRAVRDYVDILRFCPPGSEAYSIVDARAAFVAGRAAMTLDWGDTGPLAEDPKRSQVAGAVGYFLLPGTMRAWSRESARWLTFTEPYQVPFLAFGGWVASVPAASRNQAAAWDYIMWYASPANSLRDVVLPGSGVNPYRLSHFSMIDAWMSALPPAAATRYLQVIKGSLDSPRAALDLRIPGFNEYTTVFEREVFRAVKGERSVEDALAQVAGDWAAITERRGRASQRRIYRASMGLAP